jgi:hypothetical protein
MPSDASSNIRVFVRWHERTVFAGEDIKCTITFKNVAPDPSRQRQQQQQHQHQQPTSDHPRLAAAAAIAPLQARAKAPSSLTPPTSASSRGHRSALSLGGPSTASSTSSRGSAPAPHEGRQGSHGTRHQRSVSIVSIGSSGTVEDQPRNSNASSSTRPGRPRGHSRASSLQIVSRGVAAAAGGSNSGTDGQSSRDMSCRLLDEH